MTLRARALPCLTSALFLAAALPLLSCADEGRPDAAPADPSADATLLAFAGDAHRADHPLERLLAKADRTQKAKAGRARGPSIAVSSERIALVEGDALGVDVEIDVANASRKARPLTLSLAFDDALGEDGLVHAFDRTELPAGNARVTLNLRLPVDMAPRLPHERRLRVRADDGRSTIEAGFVVAVEPIDAPDVYLLIGQSNMEGYSEPDAKDAGPGGLDEPHPRVLQLHVRPNNANAFVEAADFTDEAKNVAEPLFIEAEDPLHDQSWYGLPKSGTWVGPGPSFGKAALAHTTRDVYLVPSAWGATGFCAEPRGDVAWNAEPWPADGIGGTLLLDRALTRLNMTLRETGGVLRGILWHQGGGDANDPRCVASYGDNLVAMVRRLRREARVDARGPGARGDDAAIPFVLATQSKGRDERANYVFNGGREAIDAVHRTVSTLLPWADFVNNDDLVPPAYPCGQSSCVHFGAAALREQGRRFDAALEGIRAGR